MLSCRGMEWQRRFDREEWWSAINDAIEDQQSFSGETSLGRYLDKDKYYLMNRAKLSKSKIFQTGLIFLVFFLFCIARVMFVNIVVCATGSRRGHFFNIHICIN